MMRENIEITRREVHERHNPYAYHVNTSNQPDADKVFQYTLQFGMYHARVVEDWHMQEMRLRMSADEYNKFITQRLTNEILSHIRKNITEGVEQQAAKNAPKQDIMAYLFGAK